MTPQQVEEKLCQLKHRRPFIPILVELLDGQRIEIDNPGIVINGGGAGFLGPDDGLVDFDFKNVRDVRLNTHETAQ